MKIKKYLSCKKNYPLTYLSFMVILFITIFYFNLTLDVNNIFLFIVAVVIFGIFCTNGIRGIIGHIKTAAFLTLCAFMIYYMGSANGIVQNEPFIYVLKYSFCIYLVFLILLLIANRFLQKNKNLLKFLMEIANFLVYSLLLYPILFIILIFNPETIDNKVLSEMVVKITTIPSLGFKGDFIEKSNHNYIATLIINSLGSVSLLYVLIIIMIIVCLFYPKLKDKPTTALKYITEKTKLSLRIDQMSNSFIVYNRYTKRRNEKQNKNRIKKIKNGVDKKLRKLKFVSKNSLFNFFKRAVIPLIFMIFCINIYLDYASYLVFDFNDYIKVHQYSLVFNAMVLSIIALFSNAGTIRKIKKNELLIIVVLFVFKLSIDFQNFIYEKYHILFLHYFLIYFLFKLRDFILIKKSSKILLISFVIWISYEFFIASKSYRIQNYDFLKWQIFIVSMFSLAFFEKYFFAVLSKIKKIIIPVKKENNQKTELKILIQEKQKIIEKMTFFLDYNFNKETKKNIEFELKKNKKELDYLSEKINNN